MTTQRLRSGAEAWTFQDTVEHILDVFDNARNGRPLRMARRAARESLRELQMCHRWAYYEGTHFFRTSADQTDGTIEYTHAGYATGTGTGTGTNETYSARSVVLAGATWPSDVINWKIKIGDFHYSIESRVDSDEIILPEGENPGADVAAGTSYTLYREAYSLPIGIAELGVLVDVDNNRVVPVISYDDQLTRKHLSKDTPGTPWHASIKNAGVYFNDYSLVFVAPPTAEKEYMLTYQRKPKALETELYSTGTASVASGGTTVTFGGGASLSAKHVGSVIRFGNATTDPTPVVGALDGDDNPFTDQAVILTQSGTSCTIDSAVDQAYTDVKYSISDPLDVEIGTMLTAYQRMCEAAYASLTKREMEERKQLNLEAQRALIFAMERDNKAMYMPNYAPYDPFTYVDVTDDE